MGFLFCSIALYFCLCASTILCLDDQSTLNEINPEYSLEGLMLKMKLQYLATWYKQLTHWKRPWCWEKLKAETGWDGWMASLIQWTRSWANSGRWWDDEGQGSLVCCSPWGCRVGHVLLIEEQHVLINGASQVAQWKRIHLPMQEMWVGPLGWEGSLEKEMEIHSSILAWEIPWTEEPGGLHSIGFQKSQTLLSE